MNAKLKRLKAVLLFELDIHYSYPLLESIVFFMLVLSFYYILGSGSFYQFYVIPSSLYGGQEIAASLVLWTEEHAFRTMAGTCYSISFVLAFFVPTLAALSFGRDMDTGIFRTFLSYPINRQHLFLVKESMILASTCGASSIACILALIIFEPGSISWGLTSLCLLALWTPALIVSVATSAIAVLSKSLSASLFGGVALSFGMVTIPLLFGSMGYVLMAILNPQSLFQIYIFNDYSSSILQTLLAGFIVSLVIGVFLLVMTLRRINVMEV